MEVPRASKILGQGGFGTVTDEGKYARKHFKKPEHLVRELVMLRYMSSSPYIVKIHSQNFSNLTICCKKWSCSLRDAIIRYNISPEQKMRILRHVLYGLCHMHSVDLVHSDVTLSNIFVNTKKWDTCLGDLGLSSITYYSRVNQTAEGYAPENPIPCQGHDMFGLSVCMFTLFSHSKIYKKKNASELRDLIRKSDLIPKKLKVVFQKMCPDDPRNAISAKQALWDIFGAKTDFSLPDIDLYRIRPPKEYCKFIFEQIKKLCDAYEVNRSKHCYAALIQYLSGPNAESITVEYYDLYSLAAVYIYACLYGRSMLSLAVAVETLVGRYTEEYFLYAVQALIQDTNFVALSVVSK